MLEQSWEKLYSRATSKLIVLLQPEHGFCQQNGPEGGQVQDWYPNEKCWWSTFVWMVDVVLRGVWVLHRVNKDEGEQSLLLLEKRCSKDVVNAVILKYSKESRLSSSHVGFKISHQIFVNMTQNVTKSNLNTAIFRHLR